jgi:hypothetical protein
MATYNPAAKYTWSQTDVFTLNGHEFGLVLNTLRAIVNTPEAATILLAAEAGKGIEAVMARAVEADIVKEVVDGPQTVDYADIAEKPAMAVVEDDVPESK